MQVLFTFLLKHELELVTRYLWLDTIFPCKWSVYIYHWTEKLLKSADLLPTSSFYFINFKGNVSLKILLSERFLENSALCFIVSFLKKIEGGRIDTGRRQVGGKGGYMARVCHAMYLLRSYYCKLFSNCSCALMLNCSFVVLGNVTEVSILCGSNLRKKLLLSYISASLVMLCLVSSFWLWGCVVQAPGGRKYCWDGGELWAPLQQV